MDKDETETVIACIIVILLLIIGFRFIAQTINAHDCKADAKALHIKYEYHRGWLANDKCVYILPNGKRILSTQYREME